MKLDQYSDGEIIQKILEGEIALFEILIRRNNAHLYKTGRAYSYSHEDTQDLMQDTFINAYINLAGYENRASFKTWITKIMLNNCFRKKQKSGYKNEIPDEIKTECTPMFADEQSADMTKTILTKELGLVIENALQQLPLDYRLVFSLREINGMNVSETSDILGISESNVKVRLNRAKGMLKKEIEKSYTPSEIFEFNLVYCDAMVKRVMVEIKI
ncbi:RNA polymerase, sigma-24 subunit, ECF subfamily [Sporocytophaga myxococcoides]|uniref:RNA polymerase, sigma-24 subunit, ECF subfamily n=2 Tax=Sporocytophaga myxococcoides TaxID=153721 RepID=A0A098LGD1_9BACT|nr:RNA polymerase, sigma-24 subunit, ECF subfamily [Sporocytophaga myxococcoides]